MKSKIENARNTWGNVDRVLLKYEVVFGKRKPFMRQAEKLRAAITAVDEAGVVKGKKLEGIAEDKAVLEMRAAEKADYIGDILQAYALDAENNELYRSMMFSTYDIVHLRDTIGYDKMMEVHDTAARLMDVAAEYGLTKRDLAELAEAAEAFKKKINEPRGAIVTRSVATDALDDAYRMGNNALHAMEKMINTFGNESPEAVAEFKKARIVVDNAAGWDDKGDKPGK